MFLSWNNHLISIECKLFSLHIYKKLKISNLIGTKQINEKSKINFPSIELWTKFLKIFEEFAELKSDMDFEKLSHKVSDLSSLLLENGIIYLGMPLLLQYLS